MITQSYTLSLQPGGVPLRVPCVQGDVGSRALQFKLTSNGAGVTLPSSATVSLDGTKPDGKSFSVGAALSGDTVVAYTTKQMTPVAGEVPCQLTIYDDQTILGTAQFILDVAPSAIPADPDLSQTDISSITTLWRDAQTALNQMQALKDSLCASSWTPTLSGMSSYSYQRGRYVKIGDVAIVSFSVWGIMAGSNTEQIKISGCPLIPADGGYSGGGSLSGYYTANDTIFTSWAASTDGSFYAYGQIPGSGNKWESSDIFQKTEGECGGGGTIMFKTSS